MLIKEEIADLRERMTVTEEILKKILHEIAAIKNNKHEPETL